MISQSSRLIKSTRDLRLKYKQLIARQVEQTDKNFQLSNEPVHHSSVSRSEIDTQSAIQSAIKRANRLQPVHDSEYLYQLARTPDPSEFDQTLDIFFTDQFRSGRNARSCDFKRAFHF